MFTTKKTLIVIKTIVKTRDPGDEIENEVTNSETLNPETFFSQASCKYGSFSLVLGLMHECYVISFPDVFRQMLSNFRQVTEKFHRVLLQRHPLILKSIFTGEYQYEYTCCFILIFYI